MVALHFTSTMLDKLCEVNGHHHSSFFNFKISPAIISRAAKIIFEFSVVAHQFRATAEPTLVQWLFTFSLYFKQISNSSC